MFLEITLIDGFFAKDQEIIDQAITHANYSTSIEKMQAMLKTGALLNPIKTQALSFMSKHSVILHNPSSKIRIYIEQLLSLKSLHRRLKCH